MIPRASLRLTLLFIGSVGFLAAQHPTGTLEGQVGDKEGGMIAGATVAARNLQSGFRHGSGEPLGPFTHRLAFGSFFRRARRHGSSHAQRCRTLLLAAAKTESAGIAAAALMGFSMGGESDVTPYLLARYFGLRSFATLYGFTWTAYAISAAGGSILLGRAFDLTSSYHTLLIELSVLMLLGSALMLVMPRYPAQATAAA